MAAISTKDMMEQQALVIRDPNNMQILALDMLENITDGSVVVVDASNPFAYMLEVQGTSASTAVTECESIMRQHYPGMALANGDIYRHMADGDYMNRFSKPGMQTQAIVMTRQELIGKSVPVDDGTGSRRLVIPKHTSFTVDNVTFTMQYPVVITVLNTGNISVKIDDSEISPLYRLSTNDLAWDIVDTGEDTYFIVEFPVPQMTLTSTVIQLNSFTGFSSTYSYEDYFLYARAYMRNRDGVWVEISTQHNGTVYDPNKPTVCLTVLNQSLSVYIPQIYYANGTISDSVRIDIYTTKGPVNLDFTGTEPASFRYQFRDLDRETLSVFSTPLNSFTALATYARTVCEGGAGPITFAELKRRFTNRSVTTAGLPVTNNQLSSALKDVGFDLITTLDNITNRQFTATRDIPPPADVSTVTGLGCCIQLAELTLTDLGRSNTVIDNGERLTITPATLFENVNGNLEIVSNQALSDLRNLALTNPDGIANTVNARQFYYTPFHYVLDASLDSFRVRPYLMTSPEVLTRNLFQQNESLGVDIRSSGYGIAVADDGHGYSVFVQLNANPSIRAFTADRVSLQLSFTSKNSTKRAWFTGKLITPIDSATNQPVDQVWRYQFDIKTDFDLDRNHQLRLTDSGFVVELEHQFDLVVVLKNFQPTGSGVGDIDQIVSVNHIPDYDYLSTYIAASQEKMSIRFGQYLKHLWKRSRTAVATMEYLTYDKDVPNTYSKDIYEMAGQFIKVTYDYETQKHITHKLHSKGDPIYTADGQIDIKHRKGSLIYDEVTGEPIPKLGGRDLTRLIDLFLLDGRYYFATNDSTTSYVKDSLDTVSSWITKDMVMFQQRLIERTELYYYPQASVGLIDVIVGNSVMLRMNSNTRLIVTYTLPTDKQDNAEILSTLKKNTPTTVLNAIKALIRVNGGVITKNDLNSTVKRLAGNEVLDVNVEGYFPEGYSSMLVTDVTSVPSIGKKLVALSNLTTQVQDDVEVQFNVLGSTETNRFVNLKE